VNREACILFSGAAAGAEAAFGAAAERHDVDEVNFTFPGHNDARQRGLRVLTRAELQQGAVNLATVSRLMNRRYPETPLFRKVLQTIWHQVHNGEELFVVGRVQPDDTVVGGTGIAAEYAKLFKKPVHVFDQVRAVWLRWDGEGWAAAQDPVVTRERFTGTGTRFLEPAGRTAIDELFARSFR
jgi:hypothetical protein